METEEALRKLREALGNVDLDRDVKLQVCSRGEANPDIPLGGEEEKEIFGATADITLPFLAPICKEARRGNGCYLSTTNEAMEVLVHERKPRGV